MIGLVHGGDRAHSEKVRCRNRRSENFQFLENMKSIVIKYAFVVAIAMVSGINVFNAQKSEVLSDTVLANIEALAGNEIFDGGELPGVQITCGASYGACWVQNGLCMKGEYMDYHCARTDTPIFSCVPC